MAPVSWVLNEGSAYLSSLGFHLSTCLVDLTHANGIQSLYTLVILKIKSLSGTLEARTQ